MIWPGVLLQYSEVLDRLYNMKAFYPVNLSIIKYHIFFYLTMLNNVHI